MEPAAVLLTLAEVSIATVGFAGVVSVLRGDASPEDAAMRQWRLRFMVTSGTMAVGFCLLPLPLLGDGMPPHRVWSSASALMVASNLVFTFWAYREQRDHLGAALYRGTIVNDLSLIILMVGSTVFALLNALGTLWAARFSVYLVSVMVWLTFAIVAFFRMILASSRERD